MKKNLLFLTIFLMILLSACGTNDENGENSNSNSPPTEDAEHSDSAPSVTPEPPAVELTEEEQIDADLREIVEDNYPSTDVDTITLNKNLGTEDDDSDYVALVYLTWNVKNKPDMTKKMLAMYSEDFAARIGEDIPAITDFAIFWTVPYYSEEDTAAKYSYERQGTGMSQTDAMISNIIK